MYTHRVSYTVTIYTVVTCVNRVAYDDKAFSFIVQKHNLQQIVSTRVCPGLYMKVRGEFTELIV